MPTPSEPLRQALDAFTAFAAAHDVPLLPGTLAPAPHGLPVIAYDWADDAAGNADPHAGVQRFTSTLERLDLAMAVAEIAILTADEWQSAVAACEARMAEAESLGDDELAERLEDVHARLQPLEGRVDQIATLRLTAITRNPAVVIEWSATAPWESTLSEAEAVVASDDADDEEWAARRAEHEAEERERRAWAPGPRRAEVARRLAEHPDFPRCKREADRVHLLRTMLGDDAPRDDYLTKEIAREAGAIYRLDIAPASR